MTQVFYGLAILRILQLHEQRQRQQQVLRLRRSMTTKIQRQSNVMPAQE
jgi:hypothetical protein